MYAVNTLRNSDTERSREVRSLGLKVDKRHSLFWNDGQNKFFILKVRKGNAFILSVFDQGKPHHIFFTAEDFSSLVCEIVKYCFDLPAVARQIPCPIDILKKFHACLQTQKSRVTKDGRFKVKLDDRWLEYHGYPRELEFVDDNGVYYLMPKGGRDESRGNRTEKGIKAAS